MSMRWIPTAALVLCAAFHPARTELRYAPGEGSKVAKTFTVSAALGLESLSVRMNGQELPLDEQIDMSEAEVQIDYELAVKDLFEAVAGGRAVKLARDYDQVSVKVEGMDDSDEKSMDELEGKRVVFTWNAEESRYDRAWGDGVEDGDEDVLKGLAADLDFRALLPPDDVDEGDAWEVPASELAVLFFPGFDPAHAAEMDPEGLDEALAEIPGEVLDALRSALDESSLRCTFKGLRGGGEGGDLALIELAFESEAQLDLASLVLAALAQQDEVDADVEEFSVDLYLDFTGSLLWDLKRGIFSSLELEGELQADVYVSANANMEQMSFPADLEAELSGEISIAAKAE